MQPAAMEPSEALLFPHAAKAAEQATVIVRSPQESKGLGGWLPTAARLTRFCFLLFFTAYTFLGAS